MIIDTHAHVVPGSLIETLRAERRLLQPDQVVADQQPASVVVFLRNLDLQDRLIKTELLEVAGLLLE